MEKTVILTLNLVNLKPINEHFSLMINGSYVAFPVIKTTTIRKIYRT